MPMDENPYAPPKEQNLPDCTSIELQQAEVIRRAGLRRETTREALGITKLCTMGLFLGLVAWEIRAHAISGQINIWCNLQAENSAWLHDVVFFNLLSIAGIHSLIALKLFKHENSNAQVCISGMVILLSLGAMLLFFEMLSAMIAPMILGTIHLGVIVLLRRPLPDGVTPEQYQQVVKLTPHLNQSGVVLAKWLMLMPAYFMGLATVWYLLMHLVYMN